MGLESVEIVMDVEDHFGITIQNTEAERVRTVGDLVALIQSRIEAAHVAVCPTLASFLKLRACVRELTANDTLRVRTKTRIVDVLSPAQRRILWVHFENLLGSAPPGLRRPRWLRVTLLFLSLSMQLTALIVAANTDFAILPLTFAIAVVFTIVFHLVTKLHSTIPPDDLSTFGAMAKRMAGLTVATKQLHLASTDSIMEQLRPIVAETLGINSSEVILNARFIEDLGMG
jgi:acyl carrier protein